MVREGLPLVKRRLAPPPIKVAIKETAYLIVACGIKVTAYLIVAWVFRPVWIRCSSGLTTGRRGFRVLRGLFWRVMIMRIPVLVLGLVFIIGVSPLVVRAEEPSDSAAVEPQSGIRCEEMVFCAGVRDRAPVGVSDAFPSDIYTVYCYTEIVGARDSTSIVHTWYHDEVRMASVELSVESARWRTWSSKKMARGWKGLWRVEVSSADGAVIEAKEFSLE
jgi:hypothetical protein